MQNPIPKPQPSRPSRSRNPSGGRRWSAHHWRAADRAAAFAGLPAGEDRFAVVRLLDDVGAECGWNPTLIRHLSLLIEHTRPGDWTPGHTPIVWLSRTETAHRLGLSPTQVRRNEDRLLHLRAIAYRDSPNYRRFGYRDSAGRIVQAYGIDLSPAPGLIPQLTVLSETLRRHRQEWRRLKLLLSATRRRVRQALLTAVADRFLTSAAAEVLLTELTTTASTAHDAVTIEAMHRLIADVERLEGRLRSVIDGSQRPQEAPAASPDERPQEAPAGNPDDPDRLPETDATATEYGSPGNHQGLPPLDYNTNEPLPENTAVAEGSRKEGVVAPAAPPSPESPPAAGTPDPRASSDTDRAAPARKPRVSYDTLLAVTPPAIAALLPAGRRPSWPELTDAAAIAAGSLGISRHAWGEACRVLGRRAATIAVIVIAAKRHDGQIDSPGGYLRAMTGRGERGELNLGASVHGLLQLQHGKAR